MSEELIAQAKERIADLLEPINGGVGDDVSYDEKFEQIKLEVDKANSVSGDKPNWGTVSTNAEELLQEKTKDFRVAAYLACAKCRSDLQSVLDGIVLLSEITQKFWDDMHPPLRRIRARAGMVGWWSDQAAPAVSEFKLAAKDNALVTAIEQQSTALDTLFRERFADTYTGMSAIRESIRHLVRTCPKEKPKEEPKAPPPKPAAVESGGEAAPAAAADAPPPKPRPAAPPPPPAAPALDSLTACDNALEPAGLQLVKIARAYRALKPETAVAYRLGRLGTWLSFTGAPPADGGVTLVPSPPGAMKERFDTLVSAGEFLALITEAEDACCDFPCWLDPHRYVSLAMGSMGALFLKAKEEMLMGIALFLKKIPTMPKLMFNDSTPFADGQTIMWIEQEVLPVLASGNGAGGSSAAAAPSVLDEPLKEARELAVKGELPKALGIVASAAAGAPTPLDRFRGKLAMAQLCLNAGRYAVARSQLEGLTAQITRHDLTAWDPTLCAEVYAGLYASIKGMNDALRPKATDQAAAAAYGGAPVVAVPPAEEAAELGAFRELCRLDPAVALKLGG
jgi:type VI secretion system protein VasJ